MKLLDRQQLREKVPYHPVHIRRLEKAGQFPLRVQVGPNRVGWIEDEVDAWIAERAAKRDETRPRWRK